MSKIIPISITTTEQAVTLNATYQFVWLRNMGENDCLLSDHIGIVQGDENVTLVKAGESGRITTSGKAVYVKAVSGTSTGEIHAQNFSDVPFKSKAKGGGQQITVEPLTANKNGVYTAPTGKAYSPVTVDVQEEPWQPLQDGYSNFWFELTNDTLSPWLNFSAKTNDAVIDWGDGSGEVALDTLTPTHTYSKAGKYVVKVKGVTGTNRTHSSPYRANYFSVLKNVELNADVTSVGNYTFLYCLNLQNVRMNSTVSFGTSVFDHDCNILTVQNIKTSEFSEYLFYHCYKLREITIPSTVTSIGNSCFRECLMLKNIHVQATVPPTIGNEVFTAVYNDYIIYVPVGYGDTYKSAAGWSTYADHILEEGQTPNRAMLAKFNSVKTEESEVKGDELYKDENR